MTKFLPALTDYDSLWTGVEDEEFNSATPVIKQLLDILRGYFVSLPKLVSDLKDVKQNRVLYEIGLQVEAENAAKVVEANTPGYLADAIKEDASNSSGKKKKVGSKRAHFETTLPPAEEPR